MEWSSKEERQTEGEGKWRKEGSEKKKRYKSGETIGDGLSDPAMCVDEAPLENGSSEIRARIRSLVRY